MSNQIHVELASPEKLYVNREVAMSRIPGKSKGVYAVLAGHAPMMSDMEMGIVELFNEDMNHVTDKYFVSGGFVEVTSSRCTILADKVIPVAEMSKAELESEMHRIEQDIFHSETEEERDDLEAQRATVRTKLMAFL